MWHRNTMNKLLLINDYVFLQNWKQSILCTKMHFIHSVCPVSKGLGPVLDHFEFFCCLFVGPTFSAKIPEKLLIKLVLP